MSQPENVKAAKEVLSNVMIDDEDYIDNMHNWALTETRLEHPGFGKDCELGDGSDPASAAYYANCSKFSRKVLTGLASNY